MWAKKTEAKPSRCRVIKGANEARTYIPSIAEGKDGLSLANINKFVLN